MHKLDVTPDLPPPPSQATGPTRAVSGSGNGSGSVTKSESAQHQRSGDQARTSSQHSERGAPRASPEVWYLKTIEFTSPSGEWRKYNVITQNYNGLVLIFVILSSVADT
jgi:hypothetical protein